MKDKKIQIVVAVLIVALLLVAGEILLINHLKNKDENATFIDLDQETLNSLISEINMLNSNFKKENLNEESTYNITDNYKCFRYKLDNIDEIKAHAAKVYTDVITEEDTYGMFKITKGLNKETNEERDLLFICIPSSCELTDINSAEIVNDKSLMDESLIDDDTIRLVRFNNKYLYYAKYIEGSWKLTLPVTVCASK